MATVYGIENIVTGRVYVGCTTQKLYNRMAHHRCHLRKKDHGQPDMIEDCEKHGDKSFRIFTLETLEDGATVAQKREAELRWMEYYKALGVLYNSQLISFQPGAGAMPKGHTPEANEKRRLAQLGKPKNNGAKISATKRALGQRPTLEAARAGGRVARKSVVGKPWELQGISRSAYYRARAKNLHNATHGKTDEMVSSASK